MKVLLIMRKTFGSHADHIAALRALGLDLHLVTEVVGAEEDERFRSVTWIPPGQDEDITVAAAAKLARKLDIDVAMTFAETDIVVASRVSQQLGRHWAQPEMDMIARDKKSQRDFLAAHSLPTVRYVAVSSVAEGVAAGGGIGYPLIVKPTRAAFSKGVALVHDEAGLAREMRAIEAIARSRDGNYFTGREKNYALLEEFLPGEEVTLDGVVVSGRFHLAGIINKMHMPGPYFQENYYSLPFRHPEREPELAEIASEIIAALKVRHCLFNVELRQDIAGRFRVIEFSTRMSGDYNYYNLRATHGIDGVRLYTKALLTDDYDSAWAGETPRLAPRRATCIAYSYRSGLIVRNSVGEVANSPFFVAYNPIAPVGYRIAMAPKAYEIAGALNTGMDYKALDDLESIERIAGELEKRLDIALIPDDELDD